MVVIDIKLKRELIQEIAMNSGFSLKEQPNGEMDLDHYPLKRKTSPFRARI